MSRSSCDLEPSLIPIHCLHRLGTHRQGSTRLLFAFPGKLRARQGGWDWADWGREASRSSVLFQPGAGRLSKGQPLSSKCWAAQGPADLPKKGGSDGLRTRAQASCEGVSCQTGMRSQDLRVKLGCPSGPRAAHTTRLCLIGLLTMTAI